MRTPLLLIATLILAGADFLAGRLFIGWGEGEVTTIIQGSGAKGKRYLPRLLGELTITRLRLDVLHAHGDAHLQAPEAHLVVGHSVDGAIGLFRGGAGADVVLELEQLLGFAREGIGQEVLFFPKDQ